MRKQLPEYKDHFKDIPGFYEEYRNDKWRLQIFCFKGIGILIRNAYGKVVGVQVRSDDFDDSRQRYKFLSYEFGKHNKFFRGGASVGTPIDVIIPEKTNGKLCIVEGRFKSEILAQQGLTSLSVQGVNNFKGIERDIADIEAVTGTKYEKVFLFFDADFAKNVQVYRAALSFKAYLSEKRPDLELIIAIWDEVLGKGIDDMIIAGYRNECHFIRSDYYEEVFYQSYGKAIEMCGIDVNNLVNVTKEERTRFMTVFGELVMKALM